MKDWLYNIHLICAIGGGAIGITTLTQPLYQSQNLTFLLILVLAVFFLLYVYGIWAGLKLARDRSDTKHLKIFYSLQVPVLTSPFLSYQFVAGAHVTPNLHLVGLGISFQLGSTWSFFLNSNQRFSIGLNLVAVLLLYTLAKKIANPTPQTAPASDPR